MLPDVQVFLILDLNSIIVAGERNAAALITMRDTRCKSNVETTQDAQVGNSAGRAMLRTPKKEGRTVYLLLLNR